MHRPISRGVSSDTLLTNSLGDGSTLTLDFTTGVLDPRLTFTRASDATFINSSGLVQYADANYLAQSETLSGSPWSTNGVSNTSVAVTNPNGGPDSRLIAVTASGGSKSILANASVAAGFRYTIRIWMRAGNSTSAAIGFLLGSFVTVTPSIVSGPGSVSGTNVCTVTGLTSAWTQVQMVLATTTSAGTGGFYIYPNAVANSIGDSIHLWGAQMNIGTASNPYYTTTANPYYAPRFDYDPTTLAPRGLLIEGSATSLVLQSDTLPTPTNWVANAVTRTNVSTVTPDGNTTATTCGLSHTGSGSFRSNAITVTASTAYTFSFWAKNNGGSVALYRAYNVSGSADIVAETSYFSQINGSTWTRVQFTFTTPVGCTSVYVYPLSQSSGTCNVLIWGAQLEAGSGASSYIPTGASTVTRLADNCYIYDTTTTGGLSWFKTATQGTFYVEMFKRTAGTAFAAAGFGTRATSSQDFMLYQAVGNNWLSFNWGAGEYTTNYSALSSPFLIKAAVALSPSTPATEADSTVSINGSNSALNTGPNIALPFTSDLFCIGSRGPAGGTASSQNYAETAIRRIKFFPFAMTAAQMNAMTTL